MIGELLDLFAQTPRLVGLGLYGTDFGGPVLPAFRRDFDNEFLTVDGRTIGLRSKWIGFTVPAITSMISDCSVIWQLAPYFPDVARRQYELLRHEWVRMRSDGIVQVKLGNWDKMDVGNYRRGTVSALLWLQAERDCDPVTEDGVRRLAGASTQGNLGHLLASTALTHGHFDRLNTGLPEAWASGPDLAAAAYPDVLVARAVTDGRGLDLVLRPGASPGRQPLGVKRLRPGTTYRLRGAVERDIVADSLGTARFDVDLAGRLEVQLAPASPSRQRSQRS